MGNPQGGVIWTFLRNEFLLASILGSILLAFSKTYWSQLTSVEVYSLQIFLFNLIIFLSLKTYLSNETKITNWIYVGIAIALGFNNHMTTILVLPFVTFLFFLKEKFNLVALKKIGKTFFMSLIVLIYYYLIIKNLKGDINNFLNALAPFERSEDYDLELLEKYYRRIMTKLISENIGKRNFYIGLELFQNEMKKGEFQLPEGYKIVPHLFMFKVTKYDGYVSATDPNFRIRLPQNRNKYIDFIENSVGTMLTNRIIY